MFAGLFQRDVQRPGARGGRWYRTRSGRVRYGEPPKQLWLFGQPPDKSQGRKKVARETSSERSEELRWPQPDQEPESSVRRREDAIAPVKPEPPQVPDEPPQVPAGTALERAEAIAERIKTIALVSSELLEPGQADAEELNGASEGEGGDQAEAKEQIAEAMREQGREIISKILYRHVLKQLGFKLWIQHLGGDRYGLAGHTYQVRDWIRFASEQSGAGIQFDRGLRQWVFDRDGLAALGRYLKKLGYPDAGRAAQLVQSKVEDVGVGPYADASFERLLKKRPKPPSWRADGEIAELWRRAELSEPNWRDAERVVSAAKSGKSGFLLGNGPGTGKTRLTLAAIAALRPKRALIVVPNQGVARQWMQNEAPRLGLTLSGEVERLLDSNATGIYITTYAKLRQLRAFMPQLDIAVFDEVHREAMKTLVGARQTALLVAETARRSAFSIYCTATPFERPYDLAYLFRLDMTDPKWREFSKAAARGLGRNALEAFKEFTSRYGVQWSTVRISSDQTVDRPEFHGGPRGRAHDMLRLRAQLLDEGCAVFREMEAPVPVGTYFWSTTGENHPFGKLLEKFERAWRHLADFGPLGTALSVNGLKRLADYRKLGEAAELAADAYKRGRSVVVFVSNKSGMVAEEAPHFEEGDEGYPIGQFALELRNMYAQLGITNQSLPAPTEALRDMIAEKLNIDKSEILIYTGEQTNAERARIQDEFQAGRKRIIIATIAAAGTGLNLDDQRGDQPRTQINVGLPWSGRELVQQIGRTIRAGTKSPVEQHFLLVRDNLTDMRLADVVSAKVSSLVAGTTGSNRADISTALAEYDWASGTPPDVLMQSEGPAGEVAKSTLATIASLLKTALEVLRGTISGDHRIEARD